MPVIVYPCVARCAHCIRLLGFAFALAIILPLPAHGCSRAVMIIEALRCSSALDEKAQAGKARIHVLCRVVLSEGGGGSCMPRGRALKTVLLPSNC